MPSPCIRVATDTQNFRNALHFQVVDSETTGLDTERDQPIEVAAADFLYPLDEIRNAETYPSLHLVRVHTGLFQPTVPVTPEAQAVHCIEPSELEGKPTWEEARPAWDFRTVRADMLVAHRAQFDRAMLCIAPDKPWLCTRLLAGTLNRWEQTDKRLHLNRLFRYHHDTGINTGLMDTPYTLYHCNNQTRFHRALFDVMVTAVNLRCLLNCFLSDHLTMENLGRLTRRDGFLTELRRLYPSPLI